MHRLVRIIAPLAVLAAGFGIYSLLHANKPEPEQREDPIRPVTVFVETAETAPMQLTVQTEGEVRSRVAIDLVAQVGGRIEHVSPEFTEGGSFQAGEALLTIEATDYRLALRQAEARVAAATVGVELALADADVARKQLRNTPNPSDLALKKPQVAEARATLSAAEADLEQARLNLARTQISLPFTGRVADTFVDLGQYVAPGTALGRAFATDRVEVRLPINSQQLSSLGLPIGFVASAGEEPQVDFSATVAGEEHHWRGRLIRLDAALDPATRLLYALAEVDDPYGDSVSEGGMPMAVGLFVNAAIQGRQLDNALRIPGRSLRAGERVYVVGDNSALEIRDVRVIHLSREHAVIEAGVDVGEQVIVSTIRNPIPGMAVQAAPARGLVSNAPRGDGPG